MKHIFIKRVIPLFLVAVVAILSTPFVLLKTSAGEEYSVPTTEHKLLSSYNVLSGKDITSGDAKIISSLDIFDREKLNDLFVDYASYTNMHTQYGEVHEGRDMNSFSLSAGVSLSRSVGANVGVEKLFKVSASQKFNFSVDGSYSKKTDKYFYEYVVKVQKGYYSFNTANLDEVRDFSKGYLTDTFINALTGEDGSSAAEFFERYGTHIITSYTAGGEAGITLSSVQTDTSKKIDFDYEYSSGAEGSYTTNSAITIGANLALNLKAKLDIATEESGYKSSSFVYAYGGDKAVAFTSSGNNTNFEYEAWLNSLNGENSMVLVDERLELIPIWNLMPVTGNEDRILELTTYFMYMSEEQDSAFYSNFGVDDSLFDYSQDWMNFENCKIITNEEELNQIRNDLNGVYVLANNIVLSDYANWEPIGTKEEPFRGRLYGNYNTISGLDIDITGVNCDDTVLVGIFGSNDGLITDLKVVGNIRIEEFRPQNMFVGSIVGYNKGIINNCCDDISYIIDYLPIDQLTGDVSTLIENQEVQSDKTYYINDSAGISLVGEEGITYSNTNIVIEEIDCLSPVYIILENVNIVGDSANGTIYNPTNRPVYIISVGSSNTIKGASGKPGYEAINAQASDVFLFGTAPLNIYGGTGSNGSNGSGANHYGNNGKDGNNGAVAINAANVISSIDTLSVYGGNGGRGGNGGIGWWTGDNVGRGGKGGRGGDGASAIVANQVIHFSGSVLVCGGDAGNGGTGGEGENILWSGGYGGNGGNGGDALDAVVGELVIHSSNQSKVTLLGGTPGNGGSGGYGQGRGNADKGSSGAATSYKAKMYIGDKQYSLCETKMSWNDAETYVESLGGYLVAITDTNEMNLISELVSYGTLKDYYIGAYRNSEKPSEWSWVSGEKFAFSSWDFEEPSNDSKNYVGINKESLSWKTYSDTDNGYITEVNLTSSMIGASSNDGKIRGYNISAWENNKLQINRVSKTEYFSGDKFDHSSAEIELDGKTTNFGASFNSSCKGTLLSCMGCITVSKDDYIRLIPAHITKTIPDHIEFVDVGKKEFAVDEEFDISDLSIRVIYNNGTERYIGEKDVSYTVPSTQYANQVENVTITYQESGLSFSTSYEISTVEDIVDSIFIQRKPTKLIYKQGDSLILDGMEVYETRKSGKKEIIDNNLLIIDVVPSLCNVGECLVTIKHPSNSKIIDAFTVTVESNKSFEHLWDSGTITTNPTHMLEGVMTYYCTVDNCNAMKTKSIPKLEGHGFSEWYTLNEAQHQRMCECGETIELDHTWNECQITVKPTHTTLGEAVYTCTVCGATEHRSIDKTTEHFYSEWTDIDDENHGRVCECGKTEVEEHDWNDGITIVEPTYVSMGTVKYTCLECLATVTEEIPALEIPATAPYIIVDSKNAVIGDTVTVKISLKNNPGITSMRINVQYDNTLLTLTDVKYNSTMGGQGILPENIGTLNGKLVLYWADGFTDFAADEVFATLTFKVSENAVDDSKSSITITYDSEDIYNADENNVQFFSEGGDIMFINYIPGDINGDGVVNTKDTTRLMRYLAGWNVEVNESALDVNGDGVVNTKDTTRLMRYLAGWSVDIY